MKTPGYYLPIIPYLIIDKVTDFIEFAKTVFNAEEKLIVPGKDGRIVHVEISIGKAVIMFTDSTDHYKPFPAGMFLLIENMMKFFTEPSATVLYACNRLMTESMAAAQVFRIGSVTSGGLHNRHSNYLWQRYLHQYFATIAR